MSWSVGATGKPAAVKAALEKQFESAKASTKNIEHEHQSVCLVQQIVNGQLDFLAGVHNPSAVAVSANGSVWVSNNGDHKTGGTNVSLKVEAIPGFVE